MSTHEKLRAAGARLANCAYNLAKCARLNGDERRSLDEARRDWDAAIAAQTSPVVKQNLTTQPAAAQEAVAWRDDAGNLYPDKESVDKYLPRGRTAHALYAAPVIAAPAELIERCKEILAWQRTGVLPGDALRAYANARWPDEHDPLQIAEKETAREAFRILARAAAASTSVALGIDLENFHRAVQRICIKFDGDLPYISGIAEVLDLIDASPKDELESWKRGTKACAEVLGQVMRQTQDSPKGGSEAAWDDCKVAFGFDGDEEAIWDAWKRGKLSLPPGWSFSETDGAGARMVAVFRVDGIPAPQDGETVRGLLNMLAATQAGDAEVEHG